MAGPTPRGSRPPIDLGYDMVRYELRARISQMLGAAAADTAAKPAVESMSS